MRWEEGKRAKSKRIRAIEERERGRERGSHTLLWRELLLRAFTIHLIVSIASPAAARISRAQLSLLPTYTNIRLLFYFSPYLSFGPLFSYFYLSFSFSRWCMCAFASLLQYQEDPYPPHRERHIAFAFFCCCRALTKRMGSARDGGKKSRAKVVRLTRQWQSGISEQGTGKGSKRSECSRAETREEEGQEARNYRE